MVLAFNLSTSWYYRKLEQLLSTPILWIRDSSLKRLLGSCAFRNTFISLQSAHILSPESKTDKALKVKLQMMKLETMDSKAWYSMKVLWVKKIASIDLSRFFFGRYRNINSNFDTCKFLDFFSFMRN